MEIPTKEKGKLPNWYSEHVLFSDWRNKPKPDYATNVPVAMYYTHYSGGGMRVSDKDTIIARLLRGDTLLIGADYYAMFPMTYFFSKDFRQRYGQRLYNGEVLYYKMYESHGQLVIKENIR
jgi:hypothetical protein